MPAIRPYDLQQAMIAGAKRALVRRAADLRDLAIGRVARVHDAWGKEVLIFSPEAIVMLDTAKFFEACAGDVGGLSNEARS